MSATTRVIKTCLILNIDKDLSCIEQKNNNYDICNRNNPNSYVISDCDEELLILIEFEKIAPLFSITLFATNINIDDDTDISAPKLISLYPTKHLNIDFGDMNGLNPAVSVECSNKKLKNGQMIKLTNNMKFKYLKYLVVYVKSNQSGTENTYFNGILFNNDIKHYKVDRKETKNMKLLNDILNTKDMEQEPSVPSAVTQPLQTANHCELTTCHCVENISNILKQYRLFIDTMQALPTEICNNGENDDSKSVEMVSINNVYINSAYNDTHLLNDFDHLLLQHSNEFEEIYNLFTGICYEEKICDLSQCLMLRRNQRNRFAITKNENALQKLYFNNDLCVTQQLIDRIHCYYFHTFDIGFKLPMNEVNEINEEIKQNDCDYFSFNIDKLYRSIQAKKSRYQNIVELTRLNSKTNKFSMQIEQYATGYQLYSYGVRYFYWPYYKNKNATIYDDAHNCSGSTWVMSSFSFKSKCGELSTPAANGVSSVADWYITQKSKNFKQELLDNEISHVGVEQLNHQIQKAEKHLKTNRVKDIKCKLKQRASIYELHYGYRIQAKHLIAVMIYCNFDILQRKFSETYRRKDSNDTPKQMIKRHRNFYFLGKLLRECIECFGMSNATGSDIKVYHGVGRNHIFSSMFAHIKGPFSTTTERSVAVSFCNNTGMILELNIDARWALGGDTYRLCCFDCQWISDYANEAEVFCIGGLYKFSFNTIIQTPNVDYILYINGIKQLTHYMGAGDFPDHDNVPNGYNETQMAFRLLSHEIWRYNKEHTRANEFKNCPNYIKDILHEHCKSIKTIFITNGMHGQKENKVNELIYKYDNGWMNVELLVMIFPNTDTICYDGSGKDLKFLKMKTIYNSVLKVLQRSTRLEYIDLVINPTYYSKMRIYIEEYKKSFNKYSWKIRVNYIENIYEWIPSVSGASTIKSNATRTSLVMHKSKQGNNPKITVNYV
eukprot:386710_1